MNVIKFSFVLLGLSAVLNAQAQHVGIGTSDPKALLHVADSAVLFSNEAVNFPNPMPSPPQEGRGIRMMWYPEKAAFRVGAIDDGSLLNGFSNGYPVTAWNKDSIGLFSLAGGYNTRAKGISSIALGNSSLSSGSNAAALGFYTTANGENALALGNYTSALGDGSVSAGYFTNAAGAYATALGFETIANAYSSLVIGTYNVPLISQSTNSFIDTDPLLVLGNGINYLNRSNALVVLKNGNAGFNVNAPKAKISIAQNGTELSGTAFGSMFRSNAGSLNTIVTSQIALANFGFLAGNNHASLGLRAYRNASGNDWTSTALLLQYDVDNNIQASGSTGFLALAANGNVGIGTATPTQKLQVVGNILANNVSVPSDLRYKINVETVPHALESLLQLRGARYEYNQTTFPEMHFNGGKQLGLIAQEVEKVFPSLVSTNADGMKSVNYTGLIPVLLEGMKSQQEQINILQKQLEEVRELLKKVQH